MPKNNLTKKQRETLAELEKLAKRAGLRISYGDLRFAGLKLKGGRCLFRGENWVVLDRRGSFDDQVDAFKEALDRLDLSREETSAPLPGQLTEPAGSSRPGIDGVDRPSEP